MIGKEKRFVAVIQAYVYARDYEEAVRTARKYAKHLDDFEGYENNGACVLNLYEKPYELKEIL